ncbi:hypothetical protein TNCT_192091 [Trichonephila clavata]|uniref:Secreted protein n=1 Tax=Trichonephila clavata TaxID=2740835 RepID=A0A8X6LEQ9_TRICU|nr:hypothetical protein TNCT_192091 [Trichonephila clavata]
MSIAPWTSASVLCCYSLHWMFGLKAWSHQSLNELHQVYLNRYNSGAIGLNVGHFRCCRDPTKETWKYCTSIAVVCLHKLVLELHQVYMKHCIPANL